MKEEDATMYTDLGLFELLPSSSLSFLDIHKSLIYICVSLYFGISTDKNINLPIRLVYYFRDW